MNYSVKLYWRSTSIPIASLPVMIGPFGNCSDAEQCAKSAVVANNISIAVVIDEHGEVIVRYT